MFREARHPRYRSQHAQDLFLDNFVFHGKRDGTFVEIGAFDGVSLSNTYYFETELGWRGLCVEPNPSKFAQLVANRSSPCVHCGISAAGGVLEFLQLPGDLALGSGFLEFYSPTSAFSRERPAGSTVLSVPTRRIMDLLREHGLTRIDYLSIDTEGADFDILQGIDFAKCDITALSIENSGWEERIATYMDGKGYRLAAVLGADEIYVRRV